jgi:2-methylcitrate dehydratase PrpD
MLAGRGFESRPAALECPVGFSVTHSPDFSPERALATPEGGYFLYQNLFKYHASCYLTHSVIENVLTLRPGTQFNPQAMRSMTVTVNPGLDSVCNIAAPQTGLETKFSLRHCAALALSGFDTSRLDTFSDSMARDPRLAALREKITVAFNEQQPRTFSQVVVETERGERLSASYDADVPERDLVRQKQRLTQKFLSLAAPRIGSEAAERAVDLVARLHEQPAIGPLLELCFETPARATGR